MWEILIIPIIGVAVWILSTLLRGEEDPKNPAAPRVQRKGEKVTDLDRFLREVQQRRQAKERTPEPTAQTEYRREEQPPPPPPREEPIPVVVVQPPVVVARVSAPPAPVLAAEPMAAPAQMTFHEAPPLPQKQTPPMDYLVGDLPGRPPSRALTELLVLLRSRDGLRTAMILQAVLGPPLSHRR